jgi:hypothetical protein
MNQPARKPGDPAGKLGESLSVDDPSIPVLTERLTLPPLDLNLDFRLPARPATIDETRDGENTLAPLADDVPPDTVTPLGDIEPPDPLEPEESLEPEPNESNDTVVRDPPLEPAEAEAPTTQPVADERAALLAGPMTPVEPPEPTDISPRVPTSLLVSNIDALLATPPSATPYRDPGDFDLTQDDGGRPNRLETDLREMILLDLARRLPTEVDTIVRRQLDNAIEEAIRRFAAEVRIALAGSLREIVDRAVKAELDRLNVPRR